MSSLKALSAQTPQDSTMKIKSCDANAKSRSNSNLSRDAWKYRSRRPIHQMLATIQGALILILLKVSIHLEISALQHPRTMHTPIRENIIRHPTALRYQSDVNVQSYLTGLEKTTVENTKSPLSPNVVPLWLPTHGSPHRILATKSNVLRNTLSTYLSSFEISSILNIMEATCSTMAVEDRAKCIDFVSLLASTTEMGASTLLAATVHYASTLRVNEDDTATSGDTFLFSSQLEDLLTELSSGSGQIMKAKSLRVARDASLLRDVEHLAATIVRSPGRMGPAWSPSDAKNLRHLLLSLNVHWRALAIRMVANLHRLRESALDDVNTVRRAREALYVYAPIAHRIGLTELKSELEITAFRVLYPRQHSAVTALTALDSNAQQTVMSISEGMESVLADVTRRVERRLMKDDAFLEQIENISIMSRIKEPLSLWRKILKNRRGAGGSTKKEESWTSSLSAFSAHDAVALRVILTARKLDPNESEVITSAREAALCYHVINKCMERWPLEDETRYKDYIQYPKRNGYRSLHYSTKVRWRGEEWPFELQVRSGVMHHNAEYGDAAHCDYKDNNIDGEKKVRDQYLKSVQEWRVRQLCRGKSVNGEIEEEHDELRDYENSSQILEAETKYLVERRRQRRERLSPYLEALAMARTELARERVFVFVSSSDAANGGESAGAILSLPTGACVLDALREVEKRKRFNVQSTRRHGVEVLRNGVLTSDMKQLHNGDVLDLSKPELRWG